MADHDDVARLADLILLLMGRHVDGMPADEIAVHVADFKYLVPFRSVRVHAGIVARDYRRTLAKALSDWLPTMWAETTKSAESPPTKPQQLFIQTALTSEAAFTTQCAQHGFNKENGLSILRLAAVPLAELLFTLNQDVDSAGPGPQYTGDVGERSENSLQHDASHATEVYLGALVTYCSAMPHWFPPGLAFSQIQQEVLVTPPGNDSDGPTGDDSDQSELAANTPSQNRSRPLALVTALHRYPSVLLLGGPGSGKSWATKGRCLDLWAERKASGRDEGILPILIVAARLEAKLRGIEPTAEELPRLLAESMPEDLAVRRDLVDFVANLLAIGSNIELLVDGYDEITSVRPEVGRQLGKVIALLDESSRFLLTTRPSSLPPQHVARLMATLELQPFTEREQIRFVDTWFRDRYRRAEKVRRWISTNKLELLSTPLLIALLCAVTNRPDDVPPASEPELMHRVLTRLASEEDRYSQQSATGAIVQRRIEVLEQLSLSFIADDQLLESVSGLELERSHRDEEAWRNLRDLTSKANVIDDLSSTGLLQKVERGHDVEVTFLHSAIRDYLIARALWRNSTWRKYISRIWTQPEWEPAIAYLAALLPDPDELLLSLERQFDTDPLNTARFVAGRALSLAAGRLSPERRYRPRNELVVLLGSNDTIDRNRSAALLSALQDDETAAIVRNLVNPLVPRRVVEAALRSIAGDSSRTSVDVISKCARDSRFTLGERETAVESLADLASGDALSALEAIAVDPTQTGAIRGAAAFAALRRMNSPDTARGLLASSDDHSRDARWGLAERIGVHVQSLGEFLGTMTSLGDLVPDPYCRAVIATTGKEGSSSFETLASAVPSTAPLNRLVGAVETLRAACGIDPLSAVTARFILDTSRAASLRALVASRVDDTQTPAVDFWRKLIEELPLETGIELADFLVDEASTLPPILGSALRGAIEDGSVGSVPREVALRARPQPVGAPPRTTAPTLLDDQPTPAEPSLGEILGDSSRGDLTSYQLLRGLHRAIPQGKLFAAACSLTHAVAAVGATAWIDAQPSVAAVLEQRLALSLHQEAGYELAKLRAAWPRRQGEVESTVESYNARVLSSRALASLLDEDFVDAAAMALASIGAHEADNELPAELVTRILFAAGTLTRRGGESYRQVSTYMSRFRRNGRSCDLLQAWLHLAAGSIPKVTDSISGLGPRSFESEAELTALRYAAGIGQLSDFDSIQSWSAAKSSQVFLRAVAQFSNTPLLRQRLEDAGAVLTERVRALASEWPEAALHSPGAHGRPPWQRELADIAAELLGKREYRAAAAVFDVALNRRPADPELINNHGFTIMPFDAKKALHELERAASSYSRPFAVNVANRMLLKFLSGEHSAVLSIANNYRMFGAPEPAGGTSWLWDIDDPQTLAVVDNIYLYVAELACRAARSLGDFDAADLWRIWEEEMSMRPDSSGPDVVANE